MTSPEPILKRKFNVPNKIKPTEKMQELKRVLLQMPKSERRAILDKGMEISRQRRKVAELKAEREELLKEQAKTSG